MKPTEWAYLAGLIDGEGSISIVQWTVKPNYRRTELRVTIYNTNQAMIFWLTTNFTGYATVVKTKTRPAHWKQCYAWSAHSRRAAEILKGSLPFLTAKKAQAELALQYQKTKKRSGRRGTPKTVLEQRDEMRDQIKVLNNRGPNAVAAA